MENEEMKRMNDYEYGYFLGFRDGVTSKRRILEGEKLSHGDLLSANDPYAIGYRAGLQ